MSFGDREQKEEKRCPVRVQDVSVESGESPSASCRYGRPGGTEPAPRRAAPPSHSAGLFGGVLILTVANLLVKVFGFLYKVPLNNLLGDEMANVNAAYSVYTLLYMISTAGIPVAVSVLVSEARAAGQAERVGAVFSVARTVLCAVGALGSAALLLFAPAIAGANSGGDSLLCLYAIAPALFFIAVCSVYRGYFQGFGRMTPTAVSEIIEAFGKMALGLLFVYLVTARYQGSVHLGAGFSVFGITVGIALGCFYLILTRARYERLGYLTVEGEGAARPEPRRRVLGRLLRIALPIALTAGVSSLASLIDAQFMRPLLVRYYGEAELAKTVYSDYSTGALTLFNMPAVLIYPIACAIVPYITAAKTAGKGETAAHLGETALRFGTLVSLPCALGMSALSRPILRAVFVGDADMAQNAGAPLSILALSLFPLGMIAVSNAVLQAYRKQNLPILSMAVAVIVKAVGLFALTPRLGPLAAPVSTFLFYAVAMLMNFAFLFRVSGIAPAFVRVFLCPLAAALLCALCGHWVWQSTEAFLGNTAATLLALPSAAVVYGGLILLFGCVRREDLSFIKKGGLLYRLLCKLRILKET